MSLLIDMALVLSICLLLSVLSYRFGLLTKSGGAASFFVGVVIGVFGSVNWLILLIAFTLAGFVVTKFRLNMKIERGVQEGRKGERTWKNVLANGLVPALIAIISWRLDASRSIEAGIVYLTAISVAASDTVASELGVLSDKAFLITSGVPVAAGTDGGVSIWGTFWAFMGAVLASSLGWAVIFPGTWPEFSIIIPIFMGFIGCNIDSLIGATLERKGLISKLGTNLSSMAIATTLAVLLLMLF
ncbi:MAG: DUF92 domain-containing protein [Methanomassiliicoccales archaeon]